MEVRLEPFSIVSAVVALVALGLSIYIALAYDRPSEVPAREPGGEDVSIGCGELPGWIERTASQGYTSLVRVRAGLGFRRAEDSLPRLLCPDRSYRLDFADRPDVNEGGVLVRITPDSRFVAPVRTGDLSPRADAISAHRVGVGLGVFGVLLGLFAWARRPFDPLIDHAGNRAPARAVEIEPRSNDRVIAGEPRRELAHRALAMKDGALAGASEGSGAHIGLPGAEQRYRAAAGGGPYVRGPARVNGLYVGPSGTTPLCDGDLVQLGPRAPEVRVALPRPGVVLRYLADGGAVRLALRVRDARAFWPVGAAASLGVVASATAHAEIAFRLGAGAALALGAILVAARIPPLMARRVETRVPLDDLRAGRVVIAVRDEGQAGKSVLVDGRPAGRIPAASGDRPARGALEAAIERELEVLVRQGR